MPSNRRADLPLLVLRVACMGTLVAVLALGSPGLHPAWRVVPLALLLVLQVVTAVTVPVARGSALRAEMLGSSAMAMGFAGQVALRSDSIIERIGIMAGSAFHFVFLLGLLAGLGGLAAGTYATWQRR
jgi:hypothetical protein